MKKNYLMAFFVLSMFTIKAQNAGYVLLNEYMPWTTQPCPAASEFVELYNFGPGPVNIGCYIVTDGDFTITIPPNTVLNPGQFYVISGMNSIPLGCANIDYVTNVDLNWNTCNCTSGTIPSLLGGWLTDGGSANEQVVFLDPNLKVVDAVVRDLPAETSSALTSSTVSGGCASKHFDLDTMTINYETIGESAGRGNSFARKVNGDCDWDKDPMQSGGTTNNKNNGTTSSLNSILTVSNADGCANTGSINISFTGVSNYSTIFPMNYILGKDADGNTVFNTNDTYVIGTDNTSPTVDMANLSPGYYQIAVQPKSGCNYQLFSFTILPCGNTTLEPQSFSFFATKQGKYVELLWTSEKTERVQRFEVEKSMDGINFTKIRSFTIEPKTPSFQKFKYYDQKFLTGTAFYRIKIIYNNNNVSYSSIKKIEGVNEEPGNIAISSNLSQNIMNITFKSKTRQIVNLALFQADGRIVTLKKVTATIGYNTFSIEASAMSSGTYFIKIYNQDGSSLIKKLYKE
jgi:hypothetical protein